jgi:peptidoglycan biosynthesis protein MviN/MurJ (putative lipid II flippase)
MNAMIIAVLIVLVYGNPALLLWTWVRRFKRAESSAPKWRIAMLWVSMVLATAAVLAFWITVFVAPSFHPQREIIMRIGLRLSVLLASVALLSTVFGEGPERKWVAFSSLVVPCNWIMASVWE